MGGSPRPTSLIRVSTERALPTAGRLGWWSPAAALLTSALAAVVVLRGTWGTGQYLFRDFVAVPVPARPEGVLPENASALRGWPLDAVSWAVSSVVSSGVQQGVMLAACLVLAGTGAGLLVARAGPAAAVTAAGLSVWNPYVTERLLLGQPPTLLAYASLPWIVVVVRSGWSFGVRLPLLVMVAAPAALTPWGGTMAAVVAVAAAVTRSGRRGWDVLAVAAAGIVWCLPWLVPTLLLGGVTGDPDGARAFALTDDTDRGTLLSALHGGGVWARGAQPPRAPNPWPFSRRPSSCSSRCWW